jgi:signal transduction histidine kinase
MVLCFKRLHLLLFLFLSFGAQAHIENSKKLLVYKNAIIPFQNALNKPYILMAIFAIFILTIGFLLQNYKYLKTKNLLNAQQVELSSQEITAILLEQELMLLKAFIIDEERERVRVSQEMLNTIGSKLASIKLQINHLNNSNLNNISTINFRLEETYQQFKNLTPNLVPKKFSQYKFCEVLESYLNNIGVACDIKISFLTYPKKEINEINEQLQCEVFKIIQEVVTNTIKYAKASQIEVQLNFIDDNLNVTIEDNGIIPDSKKQVEILGFANLETRVKKLNASFLIDPKLENGRIINVEIPLAAESDETGKMKVKGINIRNQLNILKNPNTKHQ